MWPNEVTQRQLEILHKIADAMSHAGILWWVFGGWGLDARIGKITRDHGDIEFWVFQEDADRTRDVVVGLGYRYVPNDYPDESYEYLDGEIKFSSAFLDQTEDGRFRSRGRFTDWQFSKNAFDGPPGRIGDLSLPAMSLEGMLGMKEQYPWLRNGKPLRDKDSRDIKIIRNLLDTR